ncbi:MAG: peptidoglycan-binding protein, partial [Pseudomonadota bacterium]|nr:peptidoglycan-binding protein [Pseudomonadota bacterium]
MPQPQQLLKAQLQEITWDENQQVSETGQPIAVQFNPETLKVGYANKSAGGDQRGGSAIQFVGQGTTKLSFDLWFDVTAGEPDRPGGGETDVRRMTEKVVNFIRPKDGGEEDKFIPPGVRFLWGTFLFEGVVDSIDESLEFFSESGLPLRAKVSLNLSKQDIQFQFGNQGGNFGNPATPGTTPQQSAREGDTVQDVASRNGRQNDWQDIASAN